MRNGWVRFVQNFIRYRLTNFHTGWYTQQRNVSRLFRKRKSKNFMILGTTPWFQQREVLKFTREAGGKGLGKGWWLQEEWIHLLLLRNIVLLVWRRNGTKWGQRHRPHRHLGLWSKSIKKGVAARTKDHCEVHFVKVLSSTYYFVHSVSRSWIVSSCVTSLIGLKILPDLLLLGWRRETTVSIGAQPCSVHLIWETMTVGGWSPMLLLLLLALSQCSTHDLTFSTCEGVSSLTLENEIML